MVNLEFKKKIVKNQKLKISTRGPRTLGIFEILSFRFLMI